MKNAWKKVNKLKKKGYKGLISTRREKPWESFGRKTTKIWLEFGSVEEREREREREREKSFLKSLKKWRTREKACFKKLSKWFTICRKLYSIDRKSHSINLASIEQRSSQANSNQGFYRVFNRSRDRFDQSKIWKKTQFFEKLSIFIAYTS